MARLKFLKGKVEDIIARYEKSKNSYNYPEYTCKQHHNNAYECLVEALRKIDCKKIDDCIYALNKCKEDLIGKCKNAEPKKIEERCADKIMEVYNYRLKVENLDLEFIRSNSDKNVLKSLFPEEYRTL